VLDFSLCKISQFSESATCLSRNICLLLHEFCLSQTFFGDAAFRLCSVHQTQMILWQKTLQKNGEKMKQRLCKRVQSVRSPAAHSNFAVSRDNFSVCCCSQGVDKVVRNIFLKASDCNTCRKKVTRYTRQQLLRAYTLGLVCATCL